ncbi:MAG: adenylate/guanylate cyclase domain-containing protein, partial [Bacteroidota bacterium]
IVRPYGLKELTFLQQVKFHIIIGLAAGILFGSTAFIFDKFIYKRVSFGKTILIGAITSIISIMLLVTLGFRALSRIMEIDLNWNFYREFVFSKEMILLIFYIFLMGFLIDFFREVDKKFGPGNLWKMLKGEFYHPKEDQRIFMFLDLKSSTTIAEQLGHEKYSKLIQSCFQDISQVVYSHKADIYQYVGDEIVLSWTIEDGLEDLSCIKFYFDYQKLLFSKKDYYQAKFGIMPEFKAGLEMGQVMVAEVGDIKREIAYHGDVLNTASRIQGCCNEFGKTILISENLERSIDELSKKHLELMGDIQLRGKQKNIKIYAVNESFSVSA